MAPPSGATVGVLAQPASIAQAATTPATAHRFSGDKTRNDVIIANLALAGLRRATHGGAEATDILALQYVSACRRCKSRGCRLRACTG